MNKRIPTPQVTDPAVRLSPGWLREAIDDALVDCASSNLTHPGIGPLPKHLHTRLRKQLERRYQKATGIKAKLVEQSNDR